LFEQRDIHFGVIRGHVETTMTEDQSDLVEGNSVPQHFCGRGMAKEVSPFRRRFDPGTSQGPLYNLRHTIAREERLERSNVSDKDTIRRLHRKPAPQIAKDRLAGVLGERQPYFVAPLPDHAQSAALPIDVRQAKLAYVAGAEPEPYEQQDDGPIPQAARSTALTGSNKTLHLLGRQASRHSG
jgi:hypothetical protein